MTLMKTLAVVTVGLAVGATVTAGQGTANGTATLKSRKGPVTVTFTHAAAVAGPDVLEAPIRRLVLSTTDVSAALKACESMLKCSDGGIREGLTLDLGHEPRHGFWFVANDQLVQHSGVVRPETVVLTTDTPTRIAGTFTLDQQASGGPVVQVTFDAPIVKTLGK
jgi:hypothetical protein